jgi:hypothetical protein
MNVCMLSLHRISLSQNCWSSFLAWAHPRPEIGGHSKVIREVRKRWHLNPQVQSHRGRYFKTHERKVHCVLLQVQLQNCFSISTFNPWPHPSLSERRWSNINYVWSLTCPQHTCTTLHHGSIKNSWTLQQDISSTYSSLAEESERKKERKKEAVLVFIWQSSVFCSRNNTSPDTQ